jgi:GGDEF domain-containing protein
MLSMRKPMPDAGDELTAALLRVPDLLLSALGLHAAKLDPWEYESFQTALGKLRDNLKNAEHDSDALVTTGQIINTIESYNRYLERYVVLHHREFQAIVSVLIGHFLDLPGASHASADKLRALERRLEKTEHIEDVRLLRTKLEELLQHMIAESLPTERPAAAPGQAFGEPQGGPGSPRALDGEDPVTGLPGYRLAELAFQQGIESGVRVYSIAFCIDRMATINERFGFQHGDQIMLSYSQQLAQQLSPGDQLFRWRGPCLVSVISRPDDESSPECIRRLGATRFDHSIESNGRTVMVPVSASWTAIRLWELESAANVRDTLNAFLSSHSRQSLTPPSAAKM